ncbi:P-type conjugative transfer ATPase TrbB [Caulobacter endophyticus]|uniref:P-type conjugative transfer ATPase TrbB n=1 Tax=Caulobacter endophyticus TaxID=2172652 RepID=UPI00240F48CA|nr:P-type conjugative transfer ATPase TrbB [Caulobacter endophyticus]MDG2528162.1 P-type conjugative transfer ATPase TrbB [Caulobacter endophyticus]
MALTDPVTATRKSDALAQALGPAVAAALVAEDVVEVMINADGRVWVERAGRGREDTGVVMGAADAERVLRLVADHAGEVVTHDQPLISATLPGGERFQGIYAPVSAGPCFVIRKRPATIFTLEDFVAQGVVDPDHAYALAEAVAARENILVAGGTGAGKTTLANALLALPAFAQDRVILIEDTAELQCSAQDQLALLTRRAAPVVTMADLVRTALRLRPDRIVIGEVRDGSALDMLKAWNTGHPGGVATLHANSAAEALDRLEDLIGEVSQRVPRRAIGRAIGLIAFLTRTSRGRALQSLLSVGGWSEETGYQLTPI